MKRAKRSRGRQIPVREDEGHSTSDTSGKVIQDIGYRAYYGDKELKFIANDIWTSGAVSATPLHTAIGNPARGAGPSARIGNKIVLTSLEMTYVLENPSSYPFTGNLNASEMCRLLVVIDHQNNLSSPTPDIDDLLLDSGGTSHYFTRGYNPLNRSRFTILHDELEAFNYQGVGADTNYIVMPNQTYPRKIKIELPDILVSYTPGGSGSRLQVLDNQIYVWIVSRYGYISMTFSEYMVRYYDV